MPTVQKGNPEVQELESEREYSVTRGWRTVRRFRGAKWAVEDFIARTLQDGSSLRLTPSDDGLATLEAWFDNAQDGSDVSSDAQITTTWSVIGNDLEKDLFDHAKFTALTQANQQLLKDLREGKIEIADAPSTGDGASFTNAIVAGQENYTLPQTVLRRSKLVSAAAAVYCINLNAGRVYPTKAALVAAEGIPVAIQTEMPLGEWLVRTGQKEQQSSGKYQISQEWWHADTWSFLYTRV